MNSGLEAEKFQVITDLGREHIRNLITIHIESETKKKQALPVCEPWKTSGIEDIQVSSEGEMELKTWN